MEILDAIIGFQKYYDDICIHFNISIYLFAYNIMVYSIGHIKETTHRVVHTVTDIVVEYIYDNSVLQ